MAALDVNLSEAEFERWLAAASTAISGLARTWRSTTVEGPPETCTSQSGAHGPAVFSLPASWQKPEEGDGA